MFGDDTATLLHGIPQKGSVLGRPDAPVTLVEFADLQRAITKLVRTLNAHPR